MGKLINKIPDSRLLVSRLLCLVLRTHVESLGKPRHSTMVLEALPGKSDIKRHSPRILYILVITQMTAQIIPLVVDLSYQNLLTQQAEYFCDSIY